jgi:hypothetical protein
MNSPVYKVGNRVSTGTLFKRHGYKVGTVVYVSPSLTYYVRVEGYPYDSREYPGFPSGDVHMWSIDSMNTYGMCLDELEYDPTQQGDLDDDI